MNKPTLSDKDIGDLFTEFMDTLELEPIEPLDVVTWSNRYPWRLRSTILKDYEDMLKCGQLRPKDRVVSAFTKIELSKLTDPRNISSRSLAFQAALGRYIAAAEAQLSHLPWLVKHLTLRQRNAKLTAAYRDINPNVFIECDFSRFDATVSRILLQQEHRVYLKLFPDMDPFARECLMVQLDTYGHHLKGVHYGTTGRRCSGDPNTSIGNAILNRFVHWAAWKHLPNWYSVHEGDDALAFISGKPQDFEEPLLRTAKALGFDIKAVITDDLEKTKFCGRCNYDIEGAVKSSCDFARTMPKFGVTTVITRSVGERIGLLRSKAMAYYNTDSHTPIIGPLCKTLLIATADVTCRSDRDLKRRLELGADSELLPPSLEDRLAFEEHTGLTPALQLSYERYYERVFRDRTAFPRVVEKLPLPFCQDEFVQDTVKYLIVDPTGLGEALNTTLTLNTTHLYD